MGAGPEKKKTEEKEESAPLGGRLTSAAAKREAREKTEP